MHFPYEFEKNESKKIMGGSGSGRHKSYLTDKCEDYRSIDIAWLRRNGAKQAGYNGKISWSRHGSVYAAIDYRVEPSGLRLIYRTRSPGSEWQDINEIIQVETTPTNFGGRRHWFQCPSCRRRCRIIYGGSYFRCRRCHHLKYESQYEKSFGHVSELRHRLRDKLGYRGSLEDPFPPKPKGMHWTTYDRLRQKDEQLGNRWAIGCMEWLKSRSPDR